MAQGTADKAEHHAGLVLYRLSPTTGAAEVLLFNDSFSPKRHWTPAKGKVVGSETDLNCARRQVGELTGLAPKDYSVEDDFRVEIKYLADTRPKRVVYLLAHVSDQTRIVPAGEGISFAWLPLQCAVDKSMFRSMHDVLRKAFEYIENVRAARVPPPGATLGTGGSHHFRTPHELDQRFLRGMNLGSPDEQFRRHPSPTHSPGQQQWSAEEERYSPVPRVGSSGPLNGAADNTLYKTRLCERFEIEGHCSYSSKCSFAHGLYELRERPLHHSHHGGPSQAGPAGENRLFKTKLCDRFAREGTCGYGSACNFAHGEAELRERPSPPFSRTHPRDGEDGDSATRAPSLPRPGGERKPRPPSEDCQLRPESPGSSAMKYPAAYGFKMRFNSDKEPTVVATPPAAGPVESGSGLRRSPAGPTEADAQQANHSDGSPYRHTTPGTARGDAAKAGGGTKGPTGAAASGLRSNGRGDLEKSVSLKELLNQEKAEQDRAWVKVVEFFGDEQEKVRRPPPKVQQRKPPSKEEQLAAELRKFMTGSLAAVQSVGPGPEQQKLLAAEVKEVTRIEFRNDMSKPQLFNVLVPSLCDAPESFAKNLRLRLQLMKTFIRSTQDQTAWINAWERWLAKNPAFLPRSAAVFKFFYDVELVEEDVFLMWHAGPVPGGGSTEVREKVRPFVEWLQSAEEED